MPFVIFLGFLFLFTIALPLLGVRVFVSVIVGRFGEAILDQYEVLNH
ncbi:MAG TPA: hypothetical protein VFN26_11530 [Candidatus Acidoferrum sp.]|nr:hypothetical protein [Candidatus Acidoferrum sp.]